MNEYSRHSVGKHLVPFELIFKKDVTSQHALDIVRKKIGTWPNSEWIYVVDSGKKLVGVVDFKTLISSKLNDKLENIMKKEVISVTDHTHQTSLAKIALKTGLGTIPVTDKDGKFMGIIDSEQILKILHEEHVDDLMKFAGILTQENIYDIFKVSVSRLALARLPWLLLGLCGGILATAIVSTFKITLQKEISLAFFIPVIVYINAAVGLQTQTIFVRTTTLEKISLKKYLWQEARIALIIGVIISLTIYGFIAIWLGPGMVGLIVASSIFVGILVSVFVAALIPWFLEKIGRDPAIASGPFTTVIQDILSILIYFLVATAILF